MPRRWAAGRALAAGWVVASASVTTAAAHTVAAREDNKRESAAGLAAAEAALARGDASLAMESFERAAAREHALNIELGIVRSFMQAGQYRRALSFASHTAAAHGDEPEGAAAYAWLLHLGAQRSVALRVLHGALERFPHAPVLTALRRAIETGEALTWLEPPLRLASYGIGADVPRDARVMSTGLLIDGGRRALAPAEAVDGSNETWVRDGLGRTVAATPERRLDVGLIVLRLDRPLDAGPDPMALAGRDAFPGAPAYVVAQAAVGTVEPAWPHMVVGFLSAVPAETAERLVGIDLGSGMGGGPVLDRTGRLVGVALRRANAGTVLVPASVLRQAGLGETASPAEPGLLSTDAVYERAMRWTLTVIARRP